jgi:hypothetical protein
MGIELTTASKSTRLGVLSALNSGIYGIPILDGTTPDGIVVYLDEATEGTSVPDGASDTFTKTYNLNRTVNSAFILFPPSGSSYLLAVPAGIEAKININALSFPSLTAVASYSPNLNSGRTLRSDEYAAPQFAGNLIYTTTNYLESKRYFGSGPFERNPYTDAAFTTGVPNATYSQIGNFLVGYYLAPFGGTQSFAEVAEGGASGTHRKVSLIAAYFSGTNLVLDFKKNEASTSAAMLRGGILILPQ